MRPRHIFLAVIVIIGFLPDLAISGPVLSRFVGNWVGSGMVRPNGFDASEKILCKVTGRQDSTLQITISGRCATASGAGVFHLSLAQNKMGDRFAAKIRLAEAAQTVDFRGRPASQGIELTQIAPVFRGDRKLTSVFMLTFLADGTLRMDNQVTNVADKMTAQSLLVMLSKR